MMKTETLDFNSVQMIELSNTELRQTDGGWWIVGLVILGVTAIYAAGYHAGYCSTHPC